MTLPAADDDIAGKSPAVRGVLDVSHPTHCAHRHDRAVEGESGTGKELVARAIHAAARARHGPFVVGQLRARSRRRCSRASSSATSAAPSPARSQRRAGLFERARRRHALPRRDRRAAARRCRPSSCACSGAARSAASAATGRIEGRRAHHRRDEPRPRARGRARAASARTSTTASTVVPLRLPPLRERREDIPLLAAHFLERFARGRPRARLALEPRPACGCSAHPWPGNVRELATCSSARRSPIRRLIF